MATSFVLDKEREAEVPRFSRDEVLLGDLLGRGGFSDVFEVTKVNLISGDQPKSLDRSISCAARSLGGMIKKESGGNSDALDDSNLNTFQYAARRFVAKHCIRQESYTPRYAIKYLSSSTIDEENSFQYGAADLITEAMFLSSLEHPNIIKIRGVSDQGPSGFAAGFEGGYFIMLDRIQSTLKQRMKIWDQNQKKVQRKYSKQFWSKKSKIKQERKNFAERLFCAVDICAALTYLHSHRIIFHDLKPENIGFDCRDDVKIFDFGLAKELDPQDRLLDDRYNLTSYTGSLRYMAPEVANGKPYNLSADVYSFSILLWGICSIGIPFHKFSREKHATLVVNGSHRPKINGTWPFPIRSLMKRGWSAELKERPSMNSCFNILKNELVQTSEVDMTRLDHVKRRSTFLIPKPHLMGYSKSQKSIRPKEA